MLLYSRNMILVSDAIASSKPVVFKLTRSTYDMVNALMHNLIKKIK